MTVTNKISTLTEWNKLLTDEPAPLRSRLPGATAPQRPGEELKKAVDVLVRQALQRSTDPTIEQAYQEAIKAVYTQFKANIVRFDIDPAISKGLLLKELVTNSFLLSNPPAPDFTPTLDRVMQHYCEDAISNLTLTLQPAALPELEKQAFQITSANVVQLVEDKIKALADLYSDPAAVKEKLAKDVYRAVLLKYKTEFESRIKQLAPLEPAFQKQLDVAFVKDIQAALSGCRTKENDLEKRYSKDKQVELEEKLKTSENAIKNQYQIVVSLDPYFRYGSIVKKGLYWISRSSSGSEQALSDALKEYKRVVQEQDAIKKELSKFVADKTADRGLLDIKRNRLQLFYSSSTERARHICQLTSVTQKEYQTLLSALEKHSPIAKPSPAVSIPAWIKKGAYSASVAVGVCAVYYGLYWGSTALVSVAAQTSVGTVLGITAKEIAVVAENLFAVAKVVTHVALKLFNSTLSKI